MKTADWMNSMTYDHWKTTNPADDELGDERERDCEGLIEALYGQVFDLKVSLGVLVALMQQDIDDGKVRATMVRRSLLADAHNLSRYETKARSNG